MLPKFLIEKTTTGERTLVEGELPLRIAPPNGPGTYQVRSVSEQSTEVTVATESEPMEEPVADSGAKPAPETAPLPDPVNLVPARIEGTGVIGTALSATPGEWENATSVTGQWLRAGVPIEAAQGSDYTPVAADDGEMLSYSETADNGGVTVDQGSDPVPATYPAPTAAGGLQDEIFDLDSGPQIVETAQDFMGEGLSFEITGAGAAIDARSGRVSIPTAAAIEGEVVTVTALNSGGRATSAFQVTVEDLDAEPQPDQVVAFTGAQDYQAPMPDNWTEYQTTGRGFIAFEYLPEGVPVAGVTAIAVQPGAGSFFLSGNGFAVVEGWPPKTISAGNPPEGKWFLNAGFVQGSRMAHWIDDAHQSNPRITSGRSMAGWSTFAVGGKANGKDYSQRRYAGIWSISGEYDDANALIQWIRSQPLGFADPSDWPGLKVNGGSSSLTIDRSMPMVQAADGTTSVSADDPALGEADWTRNGGEDAVWVNLNIPYLDRGLEMSRDPSRTTRIDVGGGSSIYGGTSFVFDKEVRAGQFVNGDWWVDPDPDKTGSPAKLISALPDSYEDSNPPANGTMANRIRNGLTVGVGGNGYDSGPEDNLPYSENQNVDPGRKGPLSLTPGTHLIKVVSKLGDRDDETGQIPSVGGYATNSYETAFKRFWTVTVIGNGTTPPANAFRPSL